MRWYGRLRRSGEIAFVRRRGRRAAAPTVVGYAVRSSKGSATIAVTVSKSVGGAVVRNLVRRRIRGALDAGLPPAIAVQLLLVARPLASTESYDRLAADVGSVVAQLAARV